MTSPAGMPTLLRTGTIGRAPAAAQALGPQRKRVRPKLQASTVRISEVDAAVRDAAWLLFDAAYAGADRDRFERDWSEKQWVILLRDPASGALKGFSTVAVTPYREAGQAARSATVVFSGDTVIDPAYWGAKALQRAFSRLILCIKLRRPTRRLYWLLVSKGYKTYLMLVRACPRAVPRWDRPDDAGLRRVLDAEARQHFGAAYDAQAGVVRHGGVKESVRPGLCPVEAPLLADPHVAFFVARNPHHAEGDELACLAEMRLRDPLRQVLRASAVARVLPPMARRQPAATPPGRSR